jgi:hypothetical protein
VVLVSVTHRQLLSEMLMYYETQSRMVSKNMANREARDGYEKVFDGYQERCRMIRQMMRDIEGGKDIREAAADWQNEIERHPERALVMDL